MGPRLQKIIRLAMVTLGAVTGGGAYVLSGGKYGGAAFLLIMHCGMLVGWITFRMLQSTAFALGHLPLPDDPRSEAYLDTVIDEELAVRVGGSTGEPMPAGEEGGQ